MEVEAGTYADFSSCNAHVLADGSRLIRLRGGGAIPYRLHSEFSREFAVRLLTRPPLNQSQRFDAALGCDGASLTFQLRPGHSSFLGEVRIDTLSASDLVKLHEKTGNDWRAVGSLTIYKWSEEEVMGTVEAISIVPTNFATPLRMAFRLDWQEGGNVSNLLDCDPYLGSRMEPKPKPLPSD